MVVVRSFPCLRKNPLACRPVGPAASGVAGVPEARGLLAAAAAPARALRQDARCPRAARPDCRPVRPSGLCGGLCGGTRYLEGACGRGAPPRGRAQRPSGGPDWPRTPGRRGLPRASRAPTTSTRPSAGGTGRTGLAAPSVHGSGVAATRLAACAAARRAAHAHQGPHRGPRASLGFAARRAGLAAARGVATLGRPRVPVMQADATAKCSPGPTPASPRACCGEQRKGKRRALRTVIPKVPFPIVRKRVDKRNGQTP